MSQADWVSVASQDTISGKRVGFRDPQDANNFKDTGIAVPGGTVTDITSGIPKQVYNVKIGPYKYVVDADGYVISTTPVSRERVGDLMQVVTADIGNDVGTKVERDDQQIPGHENYSHILSLEARDHFAIAALSMIMRNIDAPEQLDDANILLFSQAAYRWARGMMQAAADSREGDSTSQGSGTETVEVSPGDLQSNTEKILYNISQFMKQASEDGLPVVGPGSGEGDIVPILTKLHEGSVICEVTKVKEVETVGEIEVMPDVVISGTPDVRVTNTPSVSIQGTPGVTVENMPTEPIEITGSVDVTSLPTEGQQEENV